jgi:hypothetical protein
MSIYINMKKLMLNLIVILHFIFVLFVILTPFIGNNYFLVLHAFIVPFMMLHWVTNNNTCALTIMEKNLRKKIYGIEPDPDECFSYRLIAPVYDFKKNNDDLSTIIFLITIALWLVTIFRLYRNYKNGKLSSLEDLLKY